MRHTKPLSFVRSVQWTALGALLIAYVSITSPAIPGEIYRWVDEQGRVHLTDTPPNSKGTLQELKVYQPNAPGQTPAPSDPPVVAPGQVKITPTKPGGTIVIDALLNRRLTAPMLLDTGADITVLTRQVARDLRLSALDHLPTREFKTPGGTVRFPIATLQSLRVGTAEARDIEVAIDIAGHMPLGLLGMTFLRHFKVTVDHQRGQVTFER
jgi:clan AA aspartic protease (TIGR02281 family)